MSKEIDIVALGELLIDFTESGYSKNGMKLFEQNPGGAPANLLTAASHMGCSTAFVGKVGNDMHGHFLKETLKKEGIDTRAVIEDTEYFTTMAFVELDERGERSFSFARKPGADTMLRKEELDEKLLSNCKIFHFGSLSLTNEPSRSATLEAVSIAKKAGVIISYDPNYRASLWEKKETAVKEDGSHTLECTLIGGEGNEGWKIWNNECGSIIPFMCSVFLYMIVSPFCTLFSFNPIRAE